VIVPLYWKRIETLSLFSLDTILTAGENKKGEEEVKLVAGAD
jgi:hypothetical protein